MGNVLVIGPGPVTLAQGPFLQYAAARGCRRLRDAGMRVLALEDNPATMMDLGGGEGDLFMEPAASEVVTRIVESNDVFSIWYGMGGRRGWTLAMKLASDSWNESHGVRVADVDDRTLWLCGDRSLLRESLEANGIANPAFQAAESVREGQEAADRLGFPLVVRPNFSCGGWGSGLVYNLEDYPELLEEAMRESLTGEVLIEDALIGWHKYIVVAMRDSEGSICIPGVIEQVEPMPKHDEDAVLVCPPRCSGREGEYALREMARKVVEALDLCGLVEIKLAAAPGWEALYVIDINPGPWRTMPLLETATGADLLSAHIDMVMGESLPGECIALESKPCEGTTVVTSLPAYHAEREAEGYLALGCRSMGRKLFRGGDLRGAAASAMAGLTRGVGDMDAAGETVEALAGLMRSSARKASWSMGAPDAVSLVPVVAYYKARPELKDTGGGVMFLAADNDGPGGGYEANVNCMRALRKWKGENERAVLYTPDPGFALLASQEADAVFLGPLDTGAVTSAVSATSVDRLTAHYGGRTAMNLAVEMADAGVEVWGLQTLLGGVSLGMSLLKARESGIKLVDFSTSKGLEEGEKMLARAVYPLLATVEEAGGRSLHYLVYTPEEGRDLLHEHEGDILWRPVREEAQEVQVEAVAYSGGHAVLLWEQVDAAGIYSTDGLAVYPPCYLTSEQSQRALDLARETMDALGWSGNLSMRIHVNNGDINLWSLSPGPSASLPFLERASALSLASYGVLALAGRDFEVESARGSCSSVRAPLIPFGMIAESDILPSPRRRSTGAVMGVASDPGVAIAKALWSQGLRPQPGGVALLSVANRDKRRALLLARELLEAGYILKATRGTAHALAAAGIEVEAVNKLREGRPNILDLIRNGQVGLVVNIPRGKYPHSDGFYIRAASVRHGIPCMTNMEVALALARGMRQADPPAWEVMPLDGYCRPRHEIMGG
ncbi:MAG: ATP-grasp domain-containing protein [Actinobacteria bacterium]|nr:ATP-grasp domain-containing protein [Actinomycetota bacterium]